MLKCRTNRELITLRLPPGGQHEPIKVKNS
jgi:hypothetical protein